jgi:hypothetical protein
VYRFRRHARRRADQLAAATERRHRAEVDQLGATIRAATNVAWADVAVKQPARVDDRE